jgi:hypothetical protein
MTSLSHGLSSSRAQSHGCAAYIVMVEDDDPATVPGVITTGFHEWPEL